MNSLLLTKAIRFAALAHRGQMRKGTDTPYIVHPFSVGLRLSQFGFPEPVVAAGFLHDTLEDSGVTSADLAGEFGPDIAAIVVGCSEPDKSLPWRERKQHTIESLGTAPWPVKAVAAADKLDNLHAMSADFTQVGDALWSRFKQGREQQEWYYRAVFRALVSFPPDTPHAYKQLLGEFDDTLERFFARSNCTCSIVLDRHTCETARATGTPAYIVVDPETGAAKLVELPSDQSSLRVQGHEDIFSLGMAFENDDDFLPGGDWTAVSVNGPRQHEGIYRSYRIQWR